MIEPIKDVFIEHPKDEDGTDNKFVALVTAGAPIMNPSQPTESDAALFNKVMMTNGVEGGKPLGRYTISVQIARTFDPNEVLEEVTALLRRHSSAIITPTEGIVTP